MLRVLLEHTAVLLNATLLSEVFDGFLVGLVVFGGANVLPLALFLSSEQVVVVVQVFHLVEQEVGGLFLDPLL